MSKQYKKSKVIEKISQYFQDKDCKNLYKDGCINYVGITKDTKENYSKVIGKIILMYTLENLKNV